MCQLKCRLNSELLDITLSSVNDTWRINVKYLYIFYKKILRKWGLEKMGLGAIFIPKFLLLNMIKDFAFAAINGILNNPL